MDGEPIYKWETYMIPLDLVQRLCWSKNAGQRLKMLRKGKRSRRALSEALKDRGINYTQSAIQQLEDGAVESIEMNTLLAILQEIESELSALLPTARLSVGLPQ